MIRKNLDEKHEVWFKSACDLGSEIGVVPKRPRTCAKQIQRNNVPSSSPSDYYKRTITIPIVEQVLNQLKQSFSTDSETVLNGLHVVPQLMLQYVAKNQKNVWREKFSSFLDLYNDDFEEFSHDAKETEIELWEHHWQRKDLPYDIPDTISETLQRTDVSEVFEIINRALAARSVARH